MLLFNIIHDNKSIDSAYKCALVSRNYPKYKIPIQYNRYIESLLTFESQNIIYDDYSKIANISKVPFGYLYYPLKYIPSYEFEAFFQMESYNPPYHYIFVSNLSQFQFLIFWVNFLNMMINIILLIFSKT